jgi:hypothetical protein
MGLGDQLDAVRRSASASGVTVVVDLHGKLVDLTLTQDALRQRPADLATTIRRLTATASTAALTEGLALLTTTIPPTLLPPER